jgi:SAM-dependent methyltransferase
MTSETHPAFDAATYKSTTRDQWQQAAEAWDRWGPTLEDWLGPATEVMLDLAGVAEGGRVLDVAAGTGGQTIAAARRVGPAGRVLATDIAPAILEYAAANAQAAGLANVATHVADGEAIEVDAGHFDAVVSRLGLIYFPDRHAALTGMFRALRPGGRLAAIVYSLPERNGFFSVPVSVIRTAAGLPPPMPGQPGPFSLGAPGVAEAEFAAAGFVDVVAVRLDAPLRLSSATQAAQFERESFGALHQMLVGLDETGRGAAWAEVERRLAEFEAEQGFIGPCELIVVAGRRPQER